MVSAIVSVEDTRDYDCLNPYYTGRWFLLKLQMESISDLSRLNPYYTGRWFLLNN